jgi:hypothetical protein
MPYAQQVSRHNPALFVFLLDQSLSMGQPLACGASRMADELALAINTILRGLCIRAAGESGVKDWYDVAVIGYGSDSGGSPAVGPALTGPLAGKAIVSIRELFNNPARIEKASEDVIDEDTGETINWLFDMPLWLDPVVNHGSPLCTAIVNACEIVDHWIAGHTNSFPPIVINVSAGESDDGDPISYAEVLKHRRTDDGNVLFFNCCLSAVPADPFVFPENTKLLSSDWAKTLFHSSSILPQEIVRVARNVVCTVELNARCMAFNADAVALLKFLETATFRVLEE